MTQHKFRVRFQSYLDHKDPDITINITDSASASASDSGSSRQNIRVEHYYHDAWWYSNSFNSRGFFNSPLAQTPQVTHNHFYNATNNTQQEKPSDDKKEDNKNKVDLDSIVTGVFVGGVLIGSSYIVFNSYLDWYDEKCLLKDIESYKDSPDLDDRNLYNLGKHVLDNNCSYSRDMFLTKFGLIGSSCLLLLDYNYWDNRTLMNACLVGGGIAGLYGMVKYTLFHRYNNDAYTKACYKSLKDIMTNDDNVRPPAI
jgi:hypothetical protein